MYLLHGYLCFCIRLIPLHTTLTLQYTPIDYMILHLVLVKWLASFTMKARVEKMLANDVCSHLKRYIDSIVLWKIYNNKINHNDLFDFSNRYSMFYKKTCSCDLSYRENVPKADKMPFKISNYHNFKCESLNPSMKS